MVTSIKHLNFIIDHANSTMDYLDGKANIGLPFFCICMIERLSKGSKSMALLLQNIEKEPDLEFSCGIILRSLLLDALSVYNLFHIMAEEGNYKDEAARLKAAEAFCDTMLSDGLEHTLKYVKMAKDVNTISREMLEQTYKNLVSRYNIFFASYANDGTKPVLRNANRYSPAELFTRIATTRRFKELSKIYDSYLLFSKYDHFGILYFEASRQPFGDKLHKIKEAIRMFITSFSMLHAILAKYLKEEFLESQSNIASKYLFEKILKRNSKVN
ncbi:hypothetical protein [Arachidicoccus terrestris]|uniref:hypothetical protein n=1 Tax=Arachidicoccus terrestris TaxID=2875539 RepID=UPI001CC69405|nr:hypothetical protein [Arachidicoccus terrestris]UAY55762.1 hypothetical protein K9M52_01630 [Arachidicoccus terrestris]